MSKKSAASVLTLIFLGVSVCVLGATTGVLQIGTRTIQIFSAVRTQTVRLESYVDPSEVEDSQMVSSGDISLSYGIDTSFIVEMMAEEVQVFSDILVDDGFGEQLHVELDKDGLYTIELCETLSDVPPQDEAGFTAGIPVDSGAPQETQDRFLVEVKF